jgi:hypothetical protein
LLRSRILAFGATLALLGAGHAAGGAAAQAPEQLPRGSEPVQLDPADFTTTIDNPWLPIRPGTRWVYRETEGRRSTPQRVEVTVTNQTRVVAGITARVVLDVVTRRGRLVEKTFDWYAQDRYGNVWYFGEYSEAYEKGKVSTKGSWEAGVDGALPGIIMLGDPQIGDRYRQEYYAGEAEDIGEVVELDASIKVPNGSFTDLIVIEEWNPLEPKIYEDDYYAKGVGLVFEEVTKGPSEVVKLVKVRRG